MMLACGGLAWSFTMKHKVGPDGKDINIDYMKSNSLLIVKPDPFQMAFEPRSATRKQQILQNWSDAEAKDLEERRGFEETARLKLVEQNLVTAASS